MEIRSGLASTFWAQAGRKCHPNAHKTQVEKAHSKYLQAPCAVFRYWYQLCLGCLPAWQQDGQWQWLSEQVVQVPRVCPWHGRYQSLSQVMLACSISLTRILLPRHPGLLVPLPQAAEAVEPLERKAAAVGSSVLLPGPGNVTRIYSTQWEYLNGTSSRTILQYYRGSHNPAVHAPYSERAIFHPSNGSLLLEDVQESDSGTYKVTVNVGDRESLKIILEVLSKWWAWEGEEGWWMQAEQWLYLIVYGPSAGQSDLEKGLELSLIGQS